MITSVIAEVNGIKKILHYNTKTGTFIDPTNPVSTPNVTKLYTFNKTKEFEAVEGQDNIENTLEIFKVLVRD